MHKLKCKNQLNHAAQRDLPAVFAMFEVIRAAATRHEAVARIAREAAEDFEADGVTLLELRTTPKVCVSIPSGCH